jgi:hypothetical protein
MNDRIPTVYYSKARLAQVRQMLDHARDLLALAEQQQPPPPTLANLKDLARSGFQFDLQSRIEQMDCPDC